MSRSDVRTFAWLVPLALVLMVGWIFWSDGCLDVEVAKYWSIRSAPVAQVAETPPVPADVVVVENPYGDAGITGSCFLGNPDPLSVFGAQFVIVSIIGLLAALGFQRRAEWRAAVIAFTALCLVLALWQLAYVPGNTQFFEENGYGTLMHAAFYLLAF